MNTDDYIKQLDARVSRIEGWIYTALVTTLGNSIGILLVLFKLLWK